MDKEKLITALKTLKENQKRNFSQSYDLIVNLKNIDIKKNPVEFFFTLPNHKGKKIKICAFVAQELRESAEKECDLAIFETDFIKYTKDKKLIKKLASDYDLFIAQANLMGKVATVFGKTLGPKGKMPNPKAGCVVPPQAALKPLVDKLQRTIKISAKKQNNIMCMVGSEDIENEKVAENITAIVNAIIKALPNEKQNIKNILLKKTMSKPMEIKW